MGTEEGAVRRVRKHDRAGADDAFLADLDAIPNGRVDADEAAGADFHPPGNGYARRQEDVIANAGVMRDVPDKGTVLGIPAMPDRQMKRQFIAVQQLPEMIRRMRDLEKQVAELSAKAG